MGTTMNRAAAVLLLAGLLLAGASCRSKATPSPTSQPGASRASSPATATASVSATTRASERWDQVLEGTIDNAYPIRMTIHRKGNKITGSYYYLRIHTPLQLSGTLAAGGQLELTETDPQGKSTGKFTGPFAPDGSQFSGTWSSPSGRQLPFSVTVIGDQSSEEAKLASDTQTAKIAIKSATFARTKFGEKADRGKIRYPVISGLADSKVEKAINAALSAKTLLADYDPGWLEEVDVQVNHNGDGLLDISISYSGCGAYPSGYSEHRLFHLATGKQLRLRDVLMPSSFGALVRKLNQLLQKEIQDAKAGKLRDAPEECSADMYEGQFTKENLDEFVLTDKGIQFHYPYGFPHVAQACEPRGLFTIPYSDLKPLVRKDGPLADIVMQAK